MARTPDAGRVSRMAVVTGQTESHIGRYVVDLQCPDGGWVDNEDTIWCTALLARTPGKEAEAALALGWLGAQRSHLGGWGRNPREGARIPLTALAARFLGLALVADRDRAELATLWARDMEADLRLSYKGGFFLLAQDSFSDLAVATADFLYNEANPDGGFAPWKGHPIGSDPWSTGICLVGLCRFPEHADRQVIERAVEWLLRTQLPSGYWPYHFLDEGTAYAYWGLSEAAKLLEAE